MNALDIAIFNLLEGHQLVVILVKLSHDFFYERLLIGMCLFIHIELLLILDESSLSCRV